ncbi:MAG: IS21-like element helper ATPase IstB [Candidatus Xenobia bacterium]
MTQQLLIDAYLKRLKLPGVSRSFLALAREAEAANQTYEAYLLAVLEQEVQQRDTNVQKARLRQAKLPEVKTFDQFDFSAVPSLNKPKVVTLASGEYIAKAENIIFLGGNGVGKSHLATALAVCACRQGKRVRFVTAPALVNDLLEARQNYRLSRAEAGYQRVDLLIVDELGFVQFAKDGAELLFNLLARRYERKSTIVTTNLEFARWTEVMGDQTLTGALLDRMTHHAHILKIDGDSYRFKQSLRRSRGGKRNADEETETA